MTLIKFNDEMIMRFIRAYKDTPCLWDTRHPSYKDRTLRKTMYQYLVEVMNIPGYTVNDVKNKIKNIRSTYCQELKKIHQHRLLGLETYVPTNIWFAEFHEIMSTNNAQRDTHSNYMMMNYPVGECVLTENAVGAANMPFVVSSVSSINGEVADFGGDNSEATSGYSVTTNGMQSSVEATLRRLEKLSESLVRQQTEDEFDCFGKSLALQLRTLPLVKAMKLKIKIQTLMSEERIACLGEETGKENFAEQTGADDDVVVMNADDVNNTEELVQNPIVIMEEGDEQEVENREKTEKTAENAEITTEDKEEERPSSRTSALSLHVSCSSSDDDDYDDEPARESC